VTTKELYAQMEAKSQELAALFAAHTDRETGEVKATLPIDEVKAKKAEYEQVKGQYDAAAERETLRREAEATLGGLKTHDPTKRLFDSGRAGDDERGAEHVTGKSLGEVFVNSEAYKAWRKGGGKQLVSTELEFDVFRDIRDSAKATFTTAGSTLTQYDRQAGMVMIEQQRLLIRDLLAMGQTTQNTIRYPREDTFTNAATTVAEGAVKPEATFDTSEADAPVRKIAVTAKVTDELFADFPAMRDYVNNRLRFMVLQEEEDQLLNGDGVAPNLTGLLNVTGVLTQAYNTSPLETILRSATAVRTTGFFEPDGVVINPADWQAMRLAKDANNQYYGGGPFTGPYGVGQFIEEPRVWGLRPVITTAVAAGTALVGAFKIGAQFFLRQGLAVETTNSNEDDFKRNLIAIRAEERGALAVYRPKAFCIADLTP
jgi:HK97 family phage major capsid protein